MLSIEEILERKVRKAVAEAVGPLAREIAVLERTVRELAEAAKATNEASVGERLIMLSEAKKRLGVNSAKLKEIMDAGDVRRVCTPGGREKVVESSLNRYIAGLHDRKEATA